MDTAKEKTTSSLLTETSEQYLPTEKFEYDRKE